MLLRLFLLLYLLCKYCQHIKILFSYILFISVSISEGPALTLLLHSLPFHFSPDANFHLILFHGIIE